ncbi:MAG: isocitrate/isopropylmalate family dehydrogenase [Alcanivorax sp.]
MGQALNIALLPGDGIGPEVTDVAETVLNLLIQRYQLPLGYTRFDWPSHAWHQAHGEMMPGDGVAQLREFDAMLLGALGDPGPLEDPSRFVLSDSVRRGSHT